MDKKTSPYQVIARKYRPQNFSSVVGQEAIVTTLKNSLRFSRLAHAYLFCGCRGTGKTTLARLFAKALNCTQLSEDFEPCNSCPSCLDIMASSSLDVLEIDGASNRGIDDVRKINETIGYAPASGKFKIYIIDEVHMLTKEAFNALLKTLEEPPPHVKFFFATTEPHKVLPTIISRCQRFDLNRIPSEELQKKLAAIARDLNIACEEEVFGFIAHLAEGSLRDAESLLDQILCYAEPPIEMAQVVATLGLIPHHAFSSLDTAFAEQNLAFAFEMAKQVFASGKDLSYFIDSLIDHYHRILKQKLGCTESFYTTREREQIADSALLYTEEQCLYILDTLIQWQQQINKIPFKRVTLEMLLLHIIRSKHRVTLPALVKKLGEIATASPQKQEREQTVAQPVEVVVEAKKEEMPLETQNVEIVEERRREEVALEEIVVLESAEKAEEAPQNVEQALLERLQNKLKTSSTIVESNEEVKEAPPLASPPSKPSAREETLMRFAAVELEGILKKQD